MTSTTAVSQKNSNLGAAKATKNDEFYTQWADIEREMNAYLDYDPDVFRDKTILLPCDDPEWSNFAKFFALHFHDYGLKKLVATSYAPNSNAGLPSYQPTLFETEDPQFDEVKTRANGKLFVLDRDVNGDGIVDSDDLQWDYLDGDGDFRSEEVTALRDEADVVITNPPFSLFREFLGWLVAADKKFSIIGSNNVITYKEVFPLIQQNRLWKGATANSTDMVFGVPKGVPVKPSDRDKAERMGYPSDDQYDYTRLGNSCWFTNIDHGRRHERHEPLTLYKRYKADEYPTYVNYPAIEVDKVAEIPFDYDGAMGVPITFLDKYSPEQFEIVGISARDAEPMKKYAAPEDYAKNGKKVGGTGKLFIPIGDGRYTGVYQRILIKRIGDA